jgi:hypothetical protein
MLTVNQLRTFLQSLPADLDDAPIVRPGGSREFFRLNNVAAEYAREHPLYGLSVDFGEETTPTEKFGNVRKVVLIY